MIDVEPDRPHHVPRELTAVCGEGEDVGDHSPEDEALGRVAQGVDEHVAPGAAAMDVADRLHPARSNILETHCQRVDPVVRILGVVSAGHRGQPHLLGTYQVAEHT